MSDPTLDWLAAGDPAVRWQVERDLLKHTPEIWEESRARVAQTGWGRRLLDLQDPGGTWDGGIYGPKWTSTTYTLTLLRRLGLPRANDRAIAGIQRLFDASHDVGGGLSLWATHENAEKCVNGMILAIAAYFDVEDPRIDSVADYLTSGSMVDGGWNCRDFQGATHSSFHTTISVLEGLVEWKRKRGSDAADVAIDRGHEFMFDHRMYRSHRTGEVINDTWATPHFPPRWHYDVLRGLDHLHDAGAEPDERIADAVELIRSQRRRNGRWGKGSQYSGRVFFTLEPGRDGGRWNTLRSLRVLRWWDQGSVSAPRR